MNTNGFNSKQMDAVLFTVLVLLGAGARIGLQDLPNFAPVAALAMFAAYAMNSVRWAIAVPIATMALSDLFIGGYDPSLMCVVYLMFTAPVLLRRPLRKHCRLANQKFFAAARGLSALVGCSLAASVAFYLVTNLAVWALYPNFYERSLVGLASCYAAALPFFRYTLAGDLVFSLGLFGGYAILVQYMTDWFQRPAVARVKR